MGSTKVEAMDSICTWVVTVGGGMPRWGWILSMGQTVDACNLIGSICIDLSHQ